MTATSVLAQYPAVPKSGTHVVPVPCQSSGSIPSYKFRRIEPVPVQPASMQVLVLTPPSNQASPNQEVAQCAHASGAGPALLPIPQASVPVLVLTPPSNQASPNQEISQPAPANVVGPALITGPEASIQPGGFHVITRADGTAILVNGTPAGVLQPVVFQAPAPPPTTPPTAPPTVPPVAPPTAPPTAQPTPAPAEPPTAPPAPPGATPAAAQPDTPTGEGTLEEYGIETKPPVSGRLFRLESEKALDRRIAEERLKRPQRPEQTQFPTYAAISEEAYEPRVFAGLIKQIEPNFVLYGRLYGEELNAERYGWSLGPIQPIYSAAYAYKDMAMIPYNFAKRPCQRFETSAGRCYPGDPLPYLLYPFEWSATGAGWEAAVIVAAFALIP